MSQKPSAPEATLPTVIEAPPKSDPEIKGLALVELFGHQRIVGLISQQVFATGVLFRVDVPNWIKNGKVAREGFTRYFGLGAIYSISLIDEEMLRQLLPSIDGTPAARPLSLRSYDRDGDY